MKLVRPINEASETNEHPETIETNEISDSCDGSSFDRFKVQKL